MPRLDLRTKLLGTGLVLLGFTTAISALSIATISGAVDRGTAIYDKGVIPLRNLGDAHVAFAHVNRQVMTAVLDRTASLEIAAAIDNDAADVNAKILAYQGAEGVLTDAERAVSDAYRIDFATYSVALNKVMQEASSGNFTAASAFYVANQRVPPSKPSMATS